MFVFETSQRTPLISFYFESPKCPKDGNVTCGFNPNVEGEVNPTTTKIHLGLDPPKQIKERSSGKPLGPPRERFLNTCDTKAVKFSQKKISHVGFKSGNVKFLASTNSFCPPQKSQQIHQRPSRAVRGFQATQALLVQRVLSQPQMLSMAL